MTKYSLGPWMSGYDQALEVGLFGGRQVRLLEKDSTVLSATLNWVESYLARPHPDLGRPGPVCPFVPHALEMGTLWMRIERPDDVSIGSVARTIQRYATLFHKLPPYDVEAALFKTVVVIFPEIDAQQAGSLIDGAQKNLKPLFVKEGLMIGEFHMENNSPGLHNESLRPLRSPYPMLAVRHMVPSDLPFLVREADSAEERIGFLTAYVARLQGIAKPKDIDAAKVTLQALLAVKG